MLCRILPAWQGGRKMPYYYLELVTPGAESDLCDGCLLTSYAEVKEMLRESKGLRFVVTEQVVTTHC